MTEQEERNYVLMKFICPLLVATILLSACSMVFLR